MAKGPLGNSPRDLRDEFVGEDVLYKGGEPPKKARNPKKVTSNTFHSSVTGATSNKRPDRAGHFRSGGFVKGKADGGGTAYPSDASPMGPIPSKTNLSRSPDLSDPDDIAKYQPRDEPVPMPRPRPAAVSPPRQASLPDRARPVVRAAAPLVRPAPAPPPRLNPILGGPGSGSFGSGGYKKGGVLTAKTRQSLPSGDFALPGKGKGPKGAGSGSYPIPDESHARNALARASGKPVESTVRAKVHAKYPGIGKE